MKAAYIGNYGSECGVSTYNEALFNALKKQIEIKLFAEKNGNEDTLDVTYCWERTEFPKFDLIDSINAYNPDVILFSHEYGIFPKAYFFTGLVSYFRLKGYKVFTIFHSVYEHHKDKLVTESICKNVIVHSETAKKALIRKGLPKDNLHVVPHGCFSGEILPKLWNHLGNNHVILQCGFLFRYKNHLTMLDYVSELKSKYEDVLYIILASENPKCQKEHDQLYKEILTKIDKLDLIHNVIIDRGFVSNEVLMSYIRTSSVFVLPYDPDPESDVYAASGMARLVLRTATPLVVSHAHLFDGLHGATRAETKEQWINAISDVFDKKLDTKKMIDERKLFLEENSWENSARKIVNLFCEKM